MKLFLLLLPFLQPELRKVHLEGHAQGTTWLITYYATDSLVSKAQIDSIFDKIDSSLSLYKPYSLINRFNESFTGIKADSHFIRVIKKSIETWQMTNGAFDITYKSKNKGSDKIAIMDSSVIKLDSFVRIDANGIAQGYTVDVLAEFLLRNNIQNFIIELGGEIRVSGKKFPSGELFKVGIESATAEVGNIINIASGAITTSGNFRKKDHIIDPSTGQPVANELVSVTVHAKDAMTADAYDNALMVMGLKKALRFVNRRKDLAAHFIYRRSNGQFAQKESRRFKKLFQ